MQAASIAATQYALLAMICSLCLLQRQTLLILWRGFLLDQASQVEGNHTQSVYDDAGLV